MRSRPRPWSRRRPRPLEFAFLGASVVAGVLLLTHAHGSGVPTDTRSRESGARSGVPSRARVVAPCTWSFFGDPRSVAHRDLLYTGCIGVDGTVKLEQYNLDTRARHLLTLFRGLEVDDHNNPSLVFFRKKLYAFVSPHSGYLYPLNRHSTMRYRVSAHDFGAGNRWDEARTVALGKGCGLGYTYPNPVVSHKRLYLFMRGPCWYPYFTSTADGNTWAKPKTLVLGPPSTGRNVRPYAKYDGARDGSILMSFSDGHPGTYQQQPLLHALQRGQVLQGGRHAYRHHRSASVSSRPARCCAALLRRRGWAMAARSGIWERQQTRDRVLESHRTERRLPLRELRREALGHSPDRLCGRVPLRLPKRRHHPRPQRPPLDRDEPRRPWPSRDRAALHSRPCSNMGYRAADRRVERVELPACDPAWRIGVSRACSALHLRSREWFPQLSNGAPHAGDGSARRVRDSKQPTPRAAERVMSPARPSGRAAASASRRPRSARLQSSQPTSTETLAQDALSAKCGPLPWGGPETKSTAKRGFLTCAEEDSNVHPVIPAQALNVATRVSYASRSR